MKLAAMKLVTVIADIRLKDELIRFFRNAGIAGYTFYPAYGKGASRLADDSSQESENIQFKILVPEMLSVSLMKAVAEKYFAGDSVIVFQQDATVIRREKFEGRGQGT